MLITGPLALDWARRKWGFLPRLDNGAITQANPATAHRAGLWARQHVHVKGRTEWVFVKVHSHGAGDRDREAVLGSGMRRFHEALQAGFNDGRQRVLHYVTARQMYNIARAAEDGRSGDPRQFLDYEIGKPPVNR